VPGSPAPAALITIGEAPSAAMGMTYLAMADSIGLVMENAAAAQQRSQVIGEAALVQVLALIIAKGAS
jgi:Killing trait